MPSLTQTILKILGPIIWIGSSILSVFSWFIISKYRLPASKAAPIVSALLPLLDFGTTGGSLAQMTRSTARNRRNNRPMSPFFLLMNLLLLVSPTVLSTLSTQLLTDNKCALKDTWQGWFSAHDAKPIKEIQGTLECCGFGTSKEMPFPFPTNKGKDNEAVPADTCSKALGSTTACYPLWEGQLKTAGGLLVGVNSAMVIFKLIFLMITITNPALAERLFSKRGGYDDSTRRVHEIDEDAEDEGTQGYGATGRVTNGDSGAQNDETRFLMPKTHGSSGLTGVREEDEEEVEGLGTQQQQQQGQNGQRFRSEENLEGPDVWRS